jgi:AAA+ superfamily predicted ATPase
VLHFALPTAEERQELIANVLGTFRPRTGVTKQWLKCSDGLSHAEIDLATRDAIKDAILQDRKTVQTGSFLRALAERQTSQPAS